MVMKRSLTVIDTAMTEIVRAEPRAFFDPAAIRPYHRSHNIADIFTIAIGSPCTTPQLRDPQWVQSANKHIETCMCRLGGIEKGDTICQELLDAIAEHDINHVTIVSENALLFGPLLADLATTVAVKTVLTVVYADTENNYALRVKKTSGFHWRTLQQVGALYRPSIFAKARNTIVLPTDCTTRG